MALSGGRPPYTGDIAVSSSASPYVLVYAWTSTGFGTKYTDPATLPTTPISIGKSVVFHPQKHTIIIGSTTSPYISAYPWTTGTGFGTKFADPSTAPVALTTGRGVAFDPLGAYVFVLGQGAYPYSYYAWSQSTGFGSTRYLSPYTVTDDTYELTWNPTGTVIGWPSSTGTGGSYYSWSGSATTGAIDTGLVAGKTLAWSADNAYVALGYSSSPYVNVYPWNDSTGQGTAVSNPATLPPGEVNSLSFNNYTRDLACAHNSSPYISVYSFSGGFGTKYSDPSTLPTGTGNGIRWSPDGTLLAIAHATSPYISVYPWTQGLGFGAKYSNPGTLPTGTCYAVDFLPL